MQRKNAKLKKIIVLAMFLAVQALPLNALFADLSMGDHIVTLREALYRTIEENPEKTFVFTSENKHTFKALFLLDRKSINPNYGS